MKEMLKEIVQFLENHDSITDVLYPGHGGMVSFRILDEAWVNPFLQNLIINLFCRKSWWCRKLYHLSSNTNTCRYS